MVPTNVPLFDWFLRFLALAAIYHSMLFYLLINLLNKYVLSTYYVPGTLDL